MDTAKATVSWVVSGVMAWGTESRVSGMKVWVFTKSRKTGVLFKMTNCLGNLDLFVMRDLHIMVFADLFVFFMTFFVRFILADLLMWVFIFMANLFFQVFTDFLWDVMTFFDVLVFVDGLIDGLVMGLALLVCWWAMVWRMRLVTSVYIHRNCISHSQKASQSNEAFHDFCEWFVVSSLRLKRDVMP